MLNFSESGHLVFRGSSAFERADLKSKGKGRSTTTFQWQRRNHWGNSSHSYYPSSGQLSINVGGVPEARKVRRNPERLTIWKQCWCHQKRRQKIKLLRLMQEYRETCCVNTSRDSQISLNMPNWPNSAPMLVSRRHVEKKDSSSWRSMMINLRDWTDHVESTLCLEVINHLKKDVFVETRRWSILDVTVCYHQGRPYLVTESLLLGSCREWN